MNWIKSAGRSFVVFSLFLASDVLAEQASDKDVEELVITATMVEQEQSRVASSITVVTKEEIKQKQHHTVLEVLRDVPGLDVVRSGGRGGSTSVFIRGGNSEHTLVMLDGIELNDPSSPNRVFNFADLSVDNIERIEILRGAQSTLYGSDAIAGVINIITKKGSKEPQVVFSSEAGSYETYTHNFSASKQLEDSYFSVAVSRQDSSGISAAAEDDGNLEDDEYQNTSFSARGGVELSESVQADMVFRYQEGKSDLDNAGGLGGDDLNRVLDNRVAAVGLDLGAKLFDGQLKQNYRVSYADHERKDDNDPDSLNLDFQRSRYDGSLFSLELQNVLSLNDTNALVFGVDWDREKAESSFFSDSPVLGPFENNFPKEDANTAGYYLQHQLDLAAGLFSSAGLRVDDHSEFGSELTWRIAPGYTIESSGTTFRASYGTGFKAPSLSQLYSSFGNPDLEAEEVKSIDAGIEQMFWDDRANFGFSYFYNDYDQLISFNPDTFVVENIAEATTEGFEVYAGVMLIDDLELSAHYTFTETEDKATSEELLRRPENKVSVKLSYDAEPFSANLSVSYIGQREDNDFSTFPAARVKLDSYTLVDLAASYRLCPYAEIFARVENIFDEDYQEVLGYGTLGAAGYGGIRVEL